MATTVVLIACSEKKLSHAARVRHLYAGGRFQLACAWAERRGIKKMYVLSARYGILGMNDVREPYDESLASKTQRQIEEWACSVATSLFKRVDPQARVIVLADDQYAEPLRIHLPHEQYPLAGMDEAAQKTFLASD